MSCSVRRRWSAGDARGQVEVQHRPVAGAEHRRLVDGRQEAVRVHRLARLQRPLRVGHHDVGRAAIGSPTRGRRGPTSPCSGNPATTRPVNSSYCAAEWTTMSPWHDRITAMSSMQLGDVREQVGDLDAALAVLLERPPGAEQPGVALDELILRLAELLGPRLAVELVQQRLGVEGLEVAGPAGHEQEDDRPAPWPGGGAAWGPAGRPTPARSTAPGRGSRPGPGRRSRRRRRGRTRGACGSAREWGQGVRGHRGTRSG